MNTTPRLERSVTSRQNAAAILRGVVLGLLLGVAFGAGFLFRGAVPSLASPPQVDNNGGIVRAEGIQYPLLAQAQALLNEHYLRPLPEQTALEYGAIRGLLGTLNDRLTYFIEPPTAASESNVLAGQYGGIGVQVKRDEQGRFVLYPFRDSPAAKAGLMDGDVLLKVNDKDVSPDMQQDAVDQLMRGEVKDNNGVSLEVRAVVGGQEADKTRSYFIKFEVIEVPSVVWRVLDEEPNFGYVQILRFTARTPDELSKAMTELRAKSIRALVLDMRNNPGGLLQESIQVANQFLENDQIVLYERSRAQEKEYKATNGATITDLPMVVLINRGTASAAELVAGALKDHKRATLIGQTSFGKGSVQLIFQLMDKSSLHVTTAEFFPPNHATLEGIGIEPNLPMIPDEKGRDVELGEAIRYLRNEQVRG